MHGALRTVQSGLHGRGLNHSQGHLNTFLKLTGELLRGAAPQKRYCRNPLTAGDGRVRAEPARFFKELRSQV